MRGSPGMRTAPPDPWRARRGQETSSPAGLVLGIFGVLVSAVFIYAITISKDPITGTTFLLDPTRVPKLFAGFTYLTDDPPIVVLLLVLVPVLPIIQLMVVVLCGLSAERKVGPWLISTPRVIWMVVFLGLTVCGAVCSWFYPATTYDGIRLWDWLGCGIVAIALAIPHRLD